MPPPRASCTMPSPGGSTGASTCRQLPCSPSPCLATASATGPSPACASMHSNSNMQIFNSPCRPLCISSNHLGHTPFLHVLTLQTEPHSVADHLSPAGGRSGGAQSGTAAPAHLRAGSRPHCQCRCHAACSISWRSHCDADVGDGDEVGRRGSAAFRQRLIFWWSAREFWVSLMKIT